MVTMVCFTAYLLSHNIAAQNDAHRAILLHLCISMGDPLTSSHTYLSMYYHPRCRSMQFDWYMVKEVCSTAYPLSHKIAAQNDGYRVILLHLCISMGNPLTPSHIFCACTIIIDVEVCNLIDIWLLRFVLPLTRWVKTLQLKMMVTEWFCFICAPPWATPWPHLTFILALTTNTDVKGCSLIGIQSLDIYFSVCAGEQSHISKYWFSAFFASIVHLHGRPLHPMRKIFLLKPSLLMSWHALCPIRCY